MLKIENLYVYYDNNKLLENINLEVNDKEIVAIMGPNGAGKTTLGKAIIGYKYKKEGKIIFDGIDITNKKPYEIAKLGIYYTFQSPPEFDFIKNKIFLSNILEDYNENKIKEMGERLGLPKDFLDRYINNGFSGGEKKKFELLIMLLKNPKLVIFDEIDSGLDIDSIKIINDIISKRERSYIIITHYTRIFQSIKPDKVYIMKGGKIIKEGDKELIDYIEKYGYKNL